MDGSDNEGRLLAVGDIHGCRQLLERLLEQVAPTEADRVVFLGDYIDRGPDVRGTIEYLLDFGRRFPRSIFLKGNHEAMFLDFLAGRDQLPFLFNGGAITLQSYRLGRGDRLPPDHQRFFEELRLHWESDRFIFVHAGLRPGRPLAEQEERDLLWIRDEFLDSGYDWGKTVVFGHTPLSTPLFAPGRIGLDTGAVYGRALSCCDVERGIVWQQSAAG